MQALVREHVDPAVIEEHGEVVPVDPDRPTPAFDQLVEAAGDVGRHATRILAAVRPPSVDTLARSLADTGLPHALLVAVAREAIAADDPESARARALDVQRRMLQPVVNATGVLLHTNLGRAPLSPSFGTGGYANVEFDLTTGQRGSRFDHAGRLLALASGAEAAMVVNNGAAAVMLVLAALAAGEGVVVSRGELVEFGGGFRVPEVMEQSGARLIEVGTTNRTRLDDYRRHAAGDASLVLKVHQSNYRVVGFTETTSVRELSTLGLPVIVDLGSGLLDRATPWLKSGPPSWLGDEPAVRQTIEDGAALVTFSGDKLLGGPQAGVIAGSQELVDACRRHPLARALRPGGLVLAALQDLALAYLRRDGDAIPFWRMASATVDSLRARAEAIGVGEPVACMAVPGGGSAPGVEIPSYGIALRGNHMAALRAHDPPVIARIDGDATILDLRTVEPAQDAVVADAARAALS
jgi:L-seryl-tRNA(Ser) seleniumtransferase